MQPLYSELLKHASFSSECRPALSSLFIFTRLFAGHLAQQIDAPACEVVNAVILVCLLNGFWSCWVCVLVSFNLSCWPVIADRYQINRIYFLPVSGWRPWLKNTHAQTEEVVIYESMLDSILRVKMRGGTNKWNCWHHLYVDHQIHWFLLIEPS